MGRRPRLQVEGGIYHVMTRGNRRLPIFLEPDDCELFIRLLRRVVGRHEWHLHAFCLMTNHYHLLLTTPKPNASAGMCLLNGHYARTFNELHGYSGHVFERRFHSVLVERESHLLELSRYLALNPVRAQLCEQPEDWPWSSYRMTFWKKPPSFLTVEPLLTHFAGGAKSPREAYRRFVLERLQALRAA